MTKPFRPSRQTLEGIPAQRWSSFLGMGAAVAVALMGNILAARHYKRFDLTEDHRFSLSPATVETLRSLQEPVDLWILVGASEPILQTLKPLLVAYQAESSQLNVHYIDPDKDSLALEELRRRFRIETAPRGDGHVATDALAVVARGERHWFIAPTDLVEVEDGDEARVRPREEQSLTHAIRQVTAGEKARVCFTEGHGELLLSDRGERGILAFRELLEKDNYEVRGVDTTLPDAFEPYEGCRVVVAAAPRGPFSEVEANRLRTYLMEGGNLLAALGPIADADKDAFQSAGLEDALAPFGVVLDSDVVVEKESSKALPDARGAAFFAEARVHATTGNLVRREDRPPPPKVLVQFARSMHASLEPNVPRPAALLESSKDSFGLRKLSSVGNFTEIPTRTSEDLRGPLVLAMASDRLKAEGGKDATARGGRVVVLGSSRFFDERTLRDPLPVRGAAILLENSLAWLAARPAILDVPARASLAAGMRMSEESRDEVRRYVLFYLPMAGSFMALAVALWRRSSEGKSA